MQPKAFSKPKIPILDMKGKAVDKSLNQKVQERKRRNDELWFPNQQIVTFKRDNFYEAILHGSHSKLKK